MLLCLTYFIKSPLTNYRDIIMRIIPYLEIRIKIILIGIGVLLSVITSLLLVNTSLVLAQTTPPISSPSSSSSSSLIPPSSPSDNNNNNDSLPSVEITSPEDGRRVPVGELTIEGASSDDAQSNCQVYADVNDMTPMQNATASGQGGANDFSNWTFTYSPDYQVITKGVNELTAKISCFDAGLTPISKYNSINITGLPSPDTFAAPAPIPSTTTTG